MTSHLSHIAPQSGLPHVFVIPGTMMPCTGYRNQSGCVGPVGFAPSCRADDRSPHNGRVGCYIGRQSRSDTRRDWLMPIIEARFKLEKETKENSRDLSFRMPAHVGRATRTGARPKTCQLWRSALPRGTSWRILHNVRLNGSL